jgi:hypothetical protein
MTNKEISGNAWDSQVPRTAIVVGYDFKPGAEGNSQIDEVLGFHSEVFGGNAYRRIRYNEDEVQWEPSPDYCGDDALTLELMEHSSIMSFVLEAVPSKRKSKTEFTATYTAIFDIADQLYVTREYETAELAAACALYSALLILSH